jgi:hypothetical protein
VISNEFAQLIQVLMSGEPPGQLMQGGVAPAGGSSAQLIEVVTVSQPAGQPQLGYVIPGFSQRTDDLDGFGIDATSGPTVIAVAGAWMLLAGLLALAGTRPQHVAHTGRPHGRGKWA